jgi:SAM-dependent methyltransferase
MLDRLRWRFSPPGNSEAERRLLAQWRGDELTRFRGWDFSYLDDRLESTEPEWDYIGLARSHVAHSARVLDMATGGGEVYKEILTPAPQARCFACEGYRKNLPVARDTLQELGVEVRQSRRVDQLPFSNACFDLVLNRHGGFDAKELRRILAPNGIFLSQQIGGNDLDDLCTHFGRPMQWHERSHELLRSRLMDAGFVLERDESWSGEMIFRDVGALVYFLHAAPWLVANFSVLRFYPLLLQLQEQCERDGRLAFKATRQLFLTRKI